MMRVFQLVASAILTFSLSQMAVAETAGERAIAAAKQYAGTTLTIHTEAGLQALGWQQYNAKLWEELTGIKVDITSAPVNEMFVTTVQDFRGPANKDIIDVMPSYLPDLVEIGAIDPLDDWMEKYGYGEDYADIAPAYKGWGEYKGKVYGFADDGDVHIMLYRKDLIEENGENKIEFKAQYGYELRAPKTWEEWDDVSQFITDKYGPKMYGSAQPRAKGLALYFWQDMFRDYGGRFFDQETMNCTWNSEAGVKSLTAFVNQRRYMPPGVDAWGFTEAAASFMDGSVALHYTWPGVGRWAQNIGTDIEAMNWVPKSKVAGKVGYAVPPGGTPELAVGWIVSVASKGDNKEAAYLFAQWANSKEASLAKTSLGYSIRDPFRVSHYSDPGFRNLWPNAGEYLDALNEGGANGVQDLTVIQAQKYHDLISNAIQASMGGTDPKAALDKACKSADRVTKKIGVDRQRDVYSQFASQPNAYR